MARTLTSAFLGSSQLRPNRLLKEFSQLLNEAGTARVWELMLAEEIGSFILEVRGRFF